MFPPEILRWGADVVLSLQAFSSPLLDQFFSAVNFLGAEDFYIVALAVIFWCINKRAGIALALVFLLSDYAMRVLKDVTAVPRPHVLEPRIRNLDPRSDFSFPSGHVLDATVFWGFVALRFRRAWLWALAGVLVVLIALARMYLGAHHPMDVLGGIVFGAVFLLLLTRLQWGRLTARVPANYLGMMLLVAPLLLAFAYLSQETATDMGALLGILIGVAIENKRVAFDTRGRVWQQAAKIGLGLGLALALRAGIKALLPDAALSYLVRFFILGLWLSLGAPWLFVRLRLAGREQ